MKTVAVIGLGYFSRFHLAAWAARDDVRLVGVTDIDPDRVAAVARQYKVRGYTDVETLIEETNPDIVDLVVPPAAQADLIFHSIRPFRTIICQKPFCRCLTEATEIAAMAMDHGTYLIIHENFRFQPWYRTIKRFLDAGRMGQVYQARYALRPGDGRGPRAYLDRQPAFQGMERFLIQETGVHFIDLFRWLFGDIKTVYADLRRLNPAIKGEDAGQLILGHKGGAQSVFDGNRLSDHIADNPRMTMGEMVIEGEGGQLQLDGFGKISFRAFGAAQTQAVPVTDSVDPDSFGGGCVAALISHVLDNLGDESALENLAPDYLPVIRATEAAYLSDREARRVSL